MSIKKKIEDILNEAVDGIDMAELEREGNHAMADEAWKWVLRSAPQFNGFHETETAREEMRMIRKLIDTILIDRDPKAGEALYKQMIKAPGNAASVFYHSLQGMPDTVASTALLNGIRGR